MLHTLAAPWSEPYEIELGTVRAIVRRMASREGAGNDDGRDGSMGVMGASEWPGYY